jgi:uncharacterized membrane protein
MAQRKQSGKRAEPRKKHGLFGSIRTNFLTGLAVVLPVALTIYLVWSFVGFVDARVLPFLPAKYNPANYVDIRGMGLVVFLIFTTFVGALTKGLFGRSIVRMAESLVDRMPIVRSIYNGLKQIVETVFSQSSKSFEKACLVEYPRKGIWAIAFISTQTRGEVLDKSGHPEMMSVFLPTTPNPTSGFLLFVPKSDVVVLDMDVEEAAKLIISAGLVVPPTKEEKAKGLAKAARVKASSSGKSKSKTAPQAASR